MSRCSIACQAHSTKNVQVWHCGEYGECGGMGNKNFQNEKARRGPGEENEAKMF